MQMLSAMSGFDPSTMNLNPGDTNQQNIDYSQMNMGFNPYMYHNNNTGTNNTNTNSSNKNN